MLNEITLDILNGCLENYKAQENACQELNGIMAARGAQLAIQGLIQLGTTPQVVVTPPEPPTDPALTAVDGTG
jgi:hypothetical protein